jgi:hypothetical protein
MSRTVKNAKSTKLLAHLAAIRGLDRKAHFDAGGDPAGWRGQHQVQTDRLRRGRRLACRQPLREED